MAGRRYTSVFYVAIAIAALATFGVYRVLENTKASSRIATRPLVVAAKSLPEGSSIDAIAELAGRTSGAVYDHFGGKDGLLFALLESWVDDVSAVIGAELATATTLDERVAALWRNVVDPPAGVLVAPEGQAFAEVAVAEVAYRTCSARCAAVTASAGEAGAATAARTPTATRLASRYVRVPVQCQVRQMCRGRGG